MTPTEPLTQRLKRAADIVRRVIGVPDYDGYVSHMAHCHPGVAPMSRDEFFSDRLRDKYSRPGSRCC
jgi:uncharacterized short protein YbdD (DUF466 family)